ncbi:hypothetical protein BCU68_15635 [Vibrio sp. 10N.286.49.B3]|uniref:globin domain-containing protein n=1 Tax=Vibrio sp. 10N.286.49.B3 TaxID=1880855 RepID=UPI000C85D0A9|nr:globin domain-containing protein [Vibrio sp. 10N.286.49.B3]PMH41390.1 hypothetical protein BCU68_15635 [Vibrio sp. 10N.286.49.B3]
MDYNEVLYESYQRCIEKPLFLKQFLEIFSGCNPKFSMMFENVDLERQERMIKAALILLFNASGVDGIRMLVKRLVQRHRDMGIHIQAEELDIWFDALLHTVEQHDPHYNDEIKEAWIKVFSIGLNAMKEECTAS